MILSSHLFGTEYLEKCNVRITVPGRRKFHLHMSSTYKRWLTYPEIKAVQNSLLVCNSVLCLV